MRPEVAGRCAGRSVPTDTPAAGDETIFLARLSEKRGSWHGEPRRKKPMTELVTGVFAFFSAAVFLAHAYDALNVIWAKR
jgi:hypothetical protein